MFEKCLGEFTQIFSKINLISSYHYQADLNSFGNVFCRKWLLIPQNKYIINSMETTD